MNQGFQFRFVRRRHAFWKAMSLLAGGLIFSSTLSRKKECPSSIYRRVVRGGIIPDHEMPHARFEQRPPFTGEHPLQGRRGGFSLERANRRGQAGPESE